MALRKEDVYHDDHQGDDTKVGTPKKRSRITFDVSPELRRRIKMAALQDNLSVGEYVGQILDKHVPKVVSLRQKQRRPVTNKTLESLNEISEEIMQRRKGELFEGSSELIRQMREERTKELMGE